MTRRALLLVALLSVLPERLFISYLAPAVAVAAATLLVLSEPFDGRIMMAIAFILMGPGSAHPMST